MTQSLYRTATGDDHEQDDELTRAIEVTRALIRQAGKLLHDLESLSSRRGKVVPLHTSESPDTLFHRAVDAVLAHQHVSQSALQRWLRIGYEQAHRLMTELEVGQFISPASPDGTRKILIEHTAWETLKSTSRIHPSDLS